MRLCFPEVDNFAIIVIIIITTTAITIIITHHEIVLPGGHYSDIKIISLFSEIIN